MERRTMEVIGVCQQRELPRGWEFVVSVGSGSDAREYRVVFDRAYGEELTGYRPYDLKDARRLVERSFIFLLEREPKESILETFNLRDIRRFFPEYEYVMQRG